MKKIDEESRFPKIPSEIKVGIFLILISVLILTFFDKNIYLVLEKNQDVIVKILQLTVFAVMISTAIHFVIPVNFAAKYLKQNNVLYLFLATILGMLTPGPVYAIYPIVLVLRKKGVQYPILVSYLTGQTIIGPARAPFEIGLLGTNFFVYRIILSLVMGPLAGMIFILLSKIPNMDDPVKELVE